MNDSDQSRRGARASRVLASASLRSRTFLTPTCDWGARHFRKIVSARHRCNGREATARLLNQHSGRARFPEETILP